MDHSKTQPSLQIFGTADLITVRSNPRLFKAKLKKWNLSTVMRSLLSPMVNQQALKGEAAEAEDKAQRADRGRQRYRYRIGGM